MEGKGVVDKNLARSRCCSQIFVLLCHRSLDLFGALSTAGLVPIGLATLGDWFKTKTSRIKIDPLSAFLPVSPAGVLSNTNIMLTGNSVTSLCFAYKHCTNRIWHLWIIMRLKS